MSTVKSLRKLVGVLWLAGTVCTVAPALGQTEGKKNAPEVPYSAAQGACSPEETWVFSKRIPVAWRARFQRPFEKGTAPVTLALLSDILKNSQKGIEAKRLAEYWYWRSIYELGLVHVAQKGFDQLVAGAADKKGEKEVLGVRLASLQCLNRIVRAYPTQNFTQESLQGMKRLKQLEISAAERDSILEAATHSARHRLGRGEAEKSLNHEMDLLADAGPYMDFIRLMKASARASDADVVRYGEPLVSQPLPASLKTHEDNLNLLVGRAYYGLRQYQKAMIFLKKVRNTSNTFTDALTDISWSYLLDNQPSQAVSTSQNLLVGGLKHLFSPETHFIVSIALNEACHYAKGIESIRFFRKKYQKTLNWLQRWKASTSAKSRDIYPLLASYIKKEIRIPDRIATAWLRSPVFIANQEEVNLILRERELIPQVQKALGSRAKRRDPRWTTARKAMETQMATLASTSRERETQLLREINEDLVARMVRMADLLSGVHENIQLVEAELYNALGERIIADSVRPGDPDPNAKAESKNEESGPVWDWGKFPMDGDEDAEIWEDEVGFLKIDVENKCNN